MLHLKPVIFHGKIRMCVMDIEVQAISLTIRSPVMCMICVVHTRMCVEESTLHYRLSLSTPWYVSNL